MAIVDLLGVADVQIRYFEREGHDADAAQARAIRAELEELQENATAPDFGQRYRRLKRQQRSLNLRVPRSVYCSTLVTGSTAA